MWRSKRVSNMFTKEKIAWRVAVTLDIRDKSSQLAFLVGCRPGQNLDGGDKCTIMGEKHHHVTHFR